MPVRGEIRNTLAMGLRAGPGTTRDLAQRTGVGITAAMYTLRDMVVAGEVVKREPVRVAGCKRPVPVYDLAGDDGAANDGGINWALVTCWAQWPAQA